MPESSFQSLPAGTSQRGIKQESSSPSARSSFSDEKSTSSRPARRRRASSLSPSNMSSSGKPKEPTRPRQKAKTMPIRGREVAGRGSAMGMPGLLDQTGEITYTPTTHRISKAKKGKKVHACEYPGCTKIFTRAEHRKRHEANHNTSPAFQCQIEGCRKPFQRADLLARHMERQHNMPPEAFRSQYSQHSTSAASSPSRGSISAPLMGQPSTVAAPSLPQPSGAMSIGSIIEPNMRSEYASHAASGLHELSHAPIGTGPCSFAPELLYGLSPSMESPLYSSSDSCYSPLSDYLQPPAVPQQYYSQDIIQRPQSASLESCFQPIVHSPMSAEVATPSWSQYDPTSLGYGQVQETACLPPHPRLQFHSPSWPGTHGMPPYEMTVPPQQTWPWAKVNY